MGAGSGENIRTRSSKSGLSPSLEDYLEEVYRFSRTQPTIRVSDISQKLGVALPSVTKALRKLKDRECLTYQRYGMIGLTEKGQRIGNYLVERNRILQEFLASISAQCNVSAEAEAIEHYLSDSTIESIQLLVSYMKNNPKIHDELTRFICERRSLAGDIAGAADEQPHV